MKIQQERVHLPSLYVSTRLNHNTLAAVMSSPNETVYRLYLIAEGIKETQDFATIDTNEYTLTAIVRNVCAFNGDAKRQIITIPKFNDLLLKRPLYIVKCELRSLLTNKILYRCEFKHKRQELIYNQIQECIYDLEKI